MPQVWDIHLTVTGNKIYVRPDSQPVMQNDVVRFIADTQNTFEIVIHNFDLFFSGSPTLIVVQVSNAAPSGFFTVNTSANLVKYYSVSVMGVNPSPAQPDAPPRIIRTITSG